MPAHLSADFLARKEDLFWIVEDDIKSLQFNHPAGWLRGQSDYVDRVITQET